MTNKFRDGTKRAIDLFAAVTAMPIALVLTLIIMVIIRAESGGSPLFTQTRVGKNQREFKIFKLRTMYFGTDNLPSHELTTSKITRVGKILRKTKLDELPQIINILRGDMSLVGPRPCLPSQEELIAERACRGVYDIRPGITGLAQLAGLDMSTPRELAIMDGEYRARYNWRLDLELLLATVFGKGSGDAVGRTC